MSVVTLTCNSVSITLNGTIPYGTEYFHKRIGQFSVTAMSGAEFVYDSGYSKISGILMVKAVSYAEGIALRSWIKNTLNFRENHFSLQIPGIDLGLGVGNTVNGCRILETNSQGVLKAVPPNNFDVRLEYACNVT